MVIGEILTVNATNFPQKVALIMEGERHTYEQMNAESNRIANALIKRGMGEESRVAVLEKTSARAIQAIFGVAKSGAALVMINNLLRPRELEFILQDCEPSLLFLGENYIDTIANIRGKLPFIGEFVSLGQGKQGTISFQEGTEGSSPANPEKNVSEEAIFNLLYTAGTTGVPKAAVYTHSGFWQNLLSTVI
ncbi:MAG: AMP-binding protein, partial [Thermodesulfobacteriota bacterium]|nr:AMP-binding protein [Thermodesulfobacteriota bacterium]